MTTAQHCIKCGVSSHSALQGGLCGPCARLYWEQRHGKPPCDADFLTYDPRVETPFVNADLGPLEQAVVAAYGSPSPAINVDKIARMIVAQADKDERAAYNLVDQINAAVRRELYK